jgi:hypothetical protein
MELWVDWQEDRSQEARSVGEQLVVRSSTPFLVKANCTTKFNKEVGVGRIGTMIVATTDDGKTDLILQLQFWRET